METISNIANAATKAIWGEGQTSQSGEEPVSGKLGNVEAGEPYDAGNIGETSKETDALSTEKKDTERLVPGTKESTSDPASGADATKTTETSLPLPMPKPEPEAATEKLGNERNERRVPGTKESASDPASGADTTTETGTSSPLAMPKPEPEAATKEHFAGTKDQESPATTATSSAGPAKFAPSAMAMREDSTTAQNDTRPPPVSSEDKSATQAMEGKKQSLTQSYEEPKGAAINVEGPGPRPLAEVAREHGGDAGAAAKPASAKSEQSGTVPGTHLPEIERDQQQRRRDSGKGLGEAQEGGAGMGGEHGGEKMGGGTGEHYVKSSGLAAEGGDFDASKPGAGREADRLLEQKGVHREVKKGHGDGHGTDTEAGGKEKVHLKDKIKAKLHMNHSSS
ncbi:hypothetical protein N657DRAFT_690856 [Parathielavia appendiculata]|uniref:Glycine-rich cell wall structural protein 1 n=1 Tax=Parathielavia appendiculata TaxID=2587402 RepID=A0AAN6Z2I7_9PEZI|nr:hypothetical protein N657DRAFT_690856 [Parathielavia appendiculata]